MAKGDLRMTRATLVEMMTRGKVKRGWLPRWQGPGRSIRRNARAEMINQSKRKPRQKKTTTKKKKTVMLETDDGAVNLWR
jgi:hypothetical protein